MFKKLVNTNEYFFFLGIQIQKAQGVTVSL